MADHTRVPRVELTGVYGAVVRRTSREMPGHVAEPIEVAWHNRKVLNSSFAIGRHTERWDQCDEDLKPFAHPAVAGMFGCSFGLDFGYFRRIDPGLDMAEAQEVPRWRQPDAFPPLEQDVLTYAEAMTSTPPTVTDELSAALGRGALVELTMAIAVANLTARGNTALGISSPGFAGSCLVSRA